MSERLLPEGWVETTLGQVVEYGKAEKSTREQVDDDTWVLELEDIEKSSSRMIQRLSFRERHFKSTKNRFKKGDVLYGKLRPYLDKVVIADRDGVCTTEIVPLDARPHLDNRYLFHWLKSPGFLLYVNEVGYGVNMPRLGTKDGKVAPLLVAPREEQKAIADKLDELLAQVNNLKARLDAIPAILKRFRQSVLAAAVSGRLTIGEEEEVKGYKFQSIGSFASEIRYGTSKKCSSESGGTPVLRIPNVGDGVVNLNGLKYANFDDKELSKLALKPGDLLLIRSNGSLDLVGKVAVVSEKEASCVFAGYLIRLRLDLRLVDAGFVAFCLRSPMIRNVLESKARSTSGVNNINGKELAGLEVPLPTLDEQKEIVRHVDQLFAFADQVEKQVENAQARVNKLTQSILAKAFRGELTADWRAENPELISGEHSAEALLARIKAEKAAISPKRRSRKGKVSA
ncbi:restriction endonuclease subunit S [Halomonas koreensis]|uniref:Restriction endonuclease subunit S n=1 Tax=Halomonas koreensis TaxID=245385 RepID=A0ABU1G3J6_9GAMM|nr:restriction endonuclease subunit S [Halomonas koreensis]MDR5867459.1 restriction endonuclease subunit S [Halomonas koreensis]